MSLKNLLLACLRNPRAGPKEKNVSATIRLAVTLAFFVGVPCLGIENFDDFGACATSNLQNIGELLK